MNTITCHKAGRILKTFGYKGQLTVVADSGHNLFTEEPVFIIIEGKPVPFFVIAAEEKRQGEWLVSFEDINDPEKAANLCGLEFSLQAETIEDAVETDIIGFTVTDVKHGELGVVAELISLPMHDLISVKTAENKEILIPINQEFILETNKGKRLIKLDIPYDLISLNTP